MEDENKFQELQRQVQELEAKMHRIETFGAQLTVDLDSRSEDSYNREFTPSFREQLQEEIFNSVWDDHFYYYTPFESMDGWDIFQGSPVVMNAGLRLSATVGNPQGAQKNVPAVVSPVSFFDESRFRTTLFIPLGVDSLDAEYGMSVGTCTRLAPNSKHYGFIVLDGVLYGTVGDGTTSRKIKLMDIEVTDPTGLGNFPRIVEAHFYPNDRVDFFVSVFTKPTKANQQIASTGSAEVTLKHFGTLTQNLPVGAMQGGWLTFQLYSDSGSKAADIPSVEYIQKKDWRGRITSIV